MYTSTTVTRYDHTFFTGADPGLRIGLTGGGGFLRCTPQQPPMFSGVRRHAQSDICEM